MAEMMTFPKTFDEFAEQYKIIDYWEKLEEWFEYCYYMEQFHKDSIYFGWIIDGI